MAAAFPENRLRQAGIGTARITALRALYDAMNPAQQQTFRGLVASRPDEVLRRTYDPAGVPADAVVSADAVAAVLPSRLSDAVLLATFGRLRASDPSKKYRVVACAIRNVGAANNYWQPIADANHSPVGVSSVVTGTTKINVNYDFTASKIGAVIVVPDETMAEEGHFAGASVYLDRAEITIRRSKQIADYISYSGTAWSSQNGVFTISSFTNGVLILTHPTVYGSYAAVTPRGGAARAVVSSSSPSTSTTGTRISFYDVAGAQIMTPNSGMQFYLVRGDYHAATMDPQTAITTTTQPNHNLWVYGVHEVE